MHGILALYFSLTTLVAAYGPAPVLLGTAGHYAIIAKAGVSTVPQSVITGDMAISPCAQTYYTGFSYTAASTGTYATSDQVTGRLYSASDASPTPSVLTTAIGDMETAFVDAAGRSENATLFALSFTGVTFAPGLYTWGTGVHFTSDCYINGTANDTFIFQIASTLVVASGVKLILQGGAVAGNIVWVVSGAVTFGSTSSWHGIVLGKTAIHQVTGASINGRLLAQTAVTLQASTVHSYGLNTTTPTRRLTRRRELVFDI
ncbi:hypothetical protein RQP46_007329 [Phenoliferia psychrophenolica]